MDHEQVGQVEREAVSAPRDGHDEALLDPDGGHLGNGHGTRPTAQMQRDRDALGELPPGVVFCRAAPFENAFELVFRHAREPSAFSPNDAVDAARDFGHGVPLMVANAHKSPPPAPSVEEASALAGRAFSLALLALVPCCGIQLLPAGFALAFAQRARRVLAVQSVGGTPFFFANGAILLAAFVIVVNAAVLCVAGLIAASGNHLERDDLSAAFFDRPDWRNFHVPFGMGSTPFSRPPPDGAKLPTRTAVPGENLREQLAKALRDAGDERHVVVMTSYEGCTSCDDVWATFDDPLLRHALPDVTFVRVDVQAFSVEMGQLGMTRDAHPWFFLLDENGKPAAFVSADTWTDNVPMNVAKGLRDWLDEVKAQTPAPGTIQL